MKSSNAVHYTRIDHLRFGAALLVFAWHSCHYLPALPYSNVPRVFLLSIFEEGHTGVALFLTLSGFIFMSLCDGHEVAYGPFIRNRLLRVAPLLLTWTLYFFYTMGLPPERLLASTLGLLNGQGSFPGVGWTVLVEFQLYLIFPFLLTFSQRRGTRYLVGLLATMLVLRVVFWLQGADIMALSFTTVFGRIDQFLLGMLGYHLHRRHGRRLGHPLVLAAVTLAWLGIFHQFNRQGGYYDTTMPTVWIYLPTLEGAFYALITVSYLNLPITIPRAIDRPLAWLGTISYSFYLNHAVIIDIVVKAAQKRGVVFSTMTPILVMAFGVAFPATVALSALTYTFIEKPFLGLRGHYLRPLPERE